MPTMTRAAGIIIGDEILSGKVADENTPYLVKILKEAGVRLLRVAVIGDEMDEIVREARLCAAEHDYVFTSGGVGPTHDDLTMAAMAQAFDLPLERNPIIEAMVRQHWGPAVNDAALGLADLPRGARLIRTEGSMLPVVALDNIFILPGIPKLFRAKLRDLRTELKGQVLTLKSVLLNADESAVASRLSVVVAEHPTVQVGSYPRMDDPEFTVRITLEGDDARAVAAAVSRLLDLLPPECVVREE